MDILDTDTGHDGHPSAGVSTDAGLAVDEARRIVRSETPAYAAVQPHVCGECGAEIARDALFSRRTIQRAQTLATNLAQMPVCAACRPLQVEGDVGRMDGAGPLVKGSVTMGDGATRTRWMGVRRE